MNMPVNSFQSTNPYRNNILSYSGSVSEEVAQMVEAIKKDFTTRNIYYTPVNKNLDTTVLYNTLIQEGNKNQKLLGYKVFVSYPYNPIIFNIGDYITWNYGGTQDTWILISIDKTQFYNVTGEILRCNTNLNWKVNGKVVSWPASNIEQSSRQMKPDSNNVVTLQKGYMRLVLQLNDQTKLIKPNYRFLFGTQGNYSAYKVELVNNYFKENCILLDMYIDLINPNDDLVNGVAYNNDEIISPTPSPTGYDYIVSPTITDSNFNYVLQGQSQTYTIYRTNNGVQDASTFTITASNVPAEYYSMTTTGNSFTIQNLQPYDEGYLTITCVNNEDGHTNTYNVQLKALF